MSEHIQVPKMDSCAFCDYLQGRRPYTVLYRGTLAAILVTREQRGLSHLLIVPIRHVPTILDLENKESHAVMDLLRAAAHAIDQVEKCSGLSIWQNNGIDAHQAIPHLHFHVAGTLPGGSTNWGEVPELSISETDEIAKRLQTHFSLI